MTAELLFNVMSLALQQGTLAVLLGCCLLYSSKGNPLFIEMNGKLRWMTGNCDISITSKWISCSLVLGALASHYVMLYSWLHYLIFKKIIASSYNHMTTSLIRISTNRCTLLGLIFWTFILFSMVLPTQHSWNKHWTNTSIEKSKAGSLPFLSRD